MTYDELNLEELILKHNFLSAGHTIYSPQRRDDCVTRANEKDRLSSLYLPPPLMVTFTSDKSEEITESLLKVKETNEDKLTRIGSHLKILMARFKFSRQTIYRNYRQKSSWLYIWYNCTR